MSGDPSVTSGGRAVLWRGLALFVGIVTLINTVNVFSILHDRPELGVATPIILEGTSALAAIPAVFVAWVAFRLAPPDRPPVWRVLAVHAVGALVMSAAHVTLFTLMRQAAFGLMGEPYGFGPIADFPYEFRKDLVGYVLGVAGFWALARLARPAPADGATAAPATFDIRDGARVIRVDIDQILAVASAGNYVEFVLSDGRRPLMRSSLARMEAELAPFGLVRTHRSWLVNAARVNELRPEASGDYKVLVGGVEAPVSRRFPEALARLRDGQSLARST